MKYRLKNKRLSADKVKPLVMLVDDESQNINVLSILLQAEYEIISCYGGQEALDKILSMPNAADIAVIISDQRMPNMTGVEFFERSKTLIPDTVRIILTGYTDTESIVDSINKAFIFKFITKPFQPPELLMTVEHAVELYQMRLKVKVGERLKREFISTISHELRTPLNGIQGGLELIKMDRTRENEEQNIATIEQSIQHMMGLIDSILDFTVFESGTSVLCAEPVNFNVAVNETVKEYEGRCKEKNLSFEYEPLPRDTEVTTDIGKIKQIMSYLLSNAVKFTGQGSVKLSSSMPVVDGRSNLKIQVQDTGIGIEPVLQEQMFELFKQGDGSYSRRFGGLGIGLALTQKLVELFDGVLELESEPSVGTTIAIFIPLEKPQKLENISLGHIKKGTPGTTPKRVLVVEDNLVNRQILQSMLTNIGCETESCVNGEEAVLWCESKIADLIFMDCQMPVMDGLVATKNIREGNSPNRNSPIIAVTANATDYDKEKCLQAGMDLFLAKPIKKEIICNVLEQFLGITPEN